MRACPEFVIVDEAHTCAATGQGDATSATTCCAASPTLQDRHLRAPHGDAPQRRRGRLLPPPRPARPGLRGPGDGDGQRAPQAARAPRANTSSSGGGTTSRSGVQRDDATALPRSARPASSPTRSPAPGARFFDAVLAYCARSSPAARATTPQRAELLGHARADALRGFEPGGRRAGPPHAAPGRTTTPDDDRGRELARVFDGHADAWTTTSSRARKGPTHLDEESRRSIIARPSALAGQSGDPKLAARELTTSRTASPTASNPVVFCRYIATAHYVASQLAAVFKACRGGVVTGELTSEEREEAQRRGARRRRSAACWSPPTACRKASTCRTTSTPWSTTTCRGTRRATSSARAASTASARPPPQSAR